MDFEEFDDIPGTYVFTPEHSRKGYHLNMFCMTLSSVEGREAFKNDEEGCARTFPMTEEQVQSVLNRDWNGMLALGGNIYYTSKLGAYDKRSFQYLAGEMTGKGQEAYRKMMVSGGRSVEGNRSKSEW